MLWEIYQQRGISSARESAAAAASAAERVSSNLDVLEDKIDWLALVCQAMWEILSEKIPDADGLLADHIQQVDLRDGMHDGKMNRIQRTCSKCKRPMHQRHRHCLYCGHIMEKEHMFQK